MSLDIWQKIDQLDFEAIKAKLKSKKGWWWNPHLAVGTKPQVEAYEKTKGMYRTAFKDKAASHPIPAPIRAVAHSCPLYSVAVATSCITATMQATLIAATMQVIAMMQAIVTLAVMMVAVTATAVEHLVVEVRPVAAVAVVVVAAIK